MATTKKILSNKDKKKIVDVYQQQFNNSNSTPNLKYHTTNFANNTDEKETKDDIMINDAKRLTQSLRFNSRSQFDPNQLKDLQDSIR